MPQTLPLHPAQTERQISINTVRRRVAVLNVLIGEHEKKEPEPLTDEQALRLAASRLGFMAARNPRLIKTLAWQKATEGLTALINGGGR